jgi:alpha-ketoglutaric semialdehyde dehydrogenase
MKQHHNYINGQWTEAAHYARNINPSNLTDVVGEFAKGEVGQLNAAVAAASQAQAAWATSGIQLRSDAVDRVGSEILARREELGTLLAREEGKTRTEGIGEATRAGQIFKFFAGECLRLAGQLLPSVRPGISVEVTREPVGVVGLITPWNFPIAIPAWKVAPALAFGNCVVLKPADLVPASAWAMAEIISRSGIPPGVFNLVMGRGSIIGQALVEHPDVHAVSFTGSAEVGRALAVRCAATGKKVQLEMGGKNPQVVLDDADLAQAVELCAQSAFYSTGQRCTASSRLIVSDGIYPRFITALQERMALIRVGDALADGTDMGPVASESQMEQNMHYLEVGQAEGATLSCGGDRLRLANDGYYMAPALFTDSSPVMRINREEIFGPIASVIRVRSYEEALATANDTPFGLSAGIATTSLRHATHFKRHSQAGMVMVNLPTAGVDYHVPFGGRKSSSYGPREQGSYAAEFYTNVKTAYMQA